MDVKSETLLVPYKYYDEALAFCNARRAELNLEPVTALPAGYGSSSMSCPCANAVPNLIVEYTSWQFKGEDFFRTDGHPYKFVEFFDNCVGRYKLTLPIRDNRIANGD